MSRDITRLEFFVGLVLGGLAIMIVALKPSFVLTLGLPLLAVGAIELRALSRLRNADTKEAGASSWLRAAILLTILTSLLLIVPVALSGHVKSCFECDSETRTGYNYLGLFVLMWLGAALTGVAALIGWGISLVRLR